MSNPGNLLQGFPQNVSQLVGPNGQVTTQWLYLLQTLWIRSGTAQGGNGAPTGAMQPFAGPTANIPAGWLLCDGSAISRINYAALFSVIGTSWGAGDGTTTFNLPPIQNRLLLGSGTIPFGSRGGAIPLTGGSLGYAAVTYVIKI